MNALFLNPYCKSWLAGMISLEKVSVFHEVLKCLQSWQFTVPEDSQMVTLLDWFKAQLTFHEKSYLQYPHMKVHEELSGKS